jgi:SAM-dependent methyltransferase
MPTWDDAAEWYVSMVRDPLRGFNHLAADVALDLLGPVDGDVVIDIGAGEGSIARRLAVAGAQLIATEPTVALLAAARLEEQTAPLGIRYLGNGAEDLACVDDAAADAVIAVLVLHHVRNLQRGLDEIARTLRGGGRFVMVIPHPWTDHPGAGWRTHSGATQRFVGAYAHETYWSTDEADSIRSLGWHHRTMATWLSAVARADFNIEECREVAGSDLRRADSGGPWADLPRFLALRARRAHWGSHTESP